MPPMTGVRVIDAANAFEGLDHAAAALGDGMGDEQEAAGQEVSAAQSGMLLPIAHGFCTDDGCDACRLPGAPNARRTPQLEQQ